MRPTFGPSGPPHLAVHFGGRSLAFLAASACLGDPDTHGKREDGAVRAGDLIPRQQELQSTDCSCPNRVVLGEQDPGACPP